MTDLVLDPLLNRLLNGRSKTFLKKVLSPSGNRSDAVDFRIGPSFYTEKLTSEVEDDPIDTRIYRRLGHITLDPRDRRAVEAISRSYVFPPGKSPNCSKENARELVKDLIIEAKRQGDIGNINAERRVPATLEDEIPALFVLHGSRGTGKTFFLNYLIANHSNDFSREKVLWVRIDLSREVEDGFSIYRRVLTKTAKILLRYVDKDSMIAEKLHIAKLDQGLERYPIAEKVRNELKQAAFDEETKAEIRRKLDALKQEFGRQESSAPLDLRTVPEMLGHMLTEEARKAGYRFVAILDGLDRLETTEAAQFMFERLLKELREFTVVHSRRFAILAICRSSSVAEVLQQHNPYSIPKARIIKLESTSLKPIVERRAQAIEEEIQKIASEKILPSFGQTEFLRWKSEFQEFLDTLNCEEIERILGNGNRRQQLQAIQNRYLQHKERGNSYHSIELLTLAGRCYPPKFFRYGWTKNGRWIRRRHDPVPVDHRFVPTIFSYPDIFDEGGHPEENGGLNTLPMLGIRILQLLEAFRTVHGGDIDQDDGFILEDLYSILGKMGYRRDEVLAVLEELMEFELVNLSGGISEWATDSWRIHATLLPKGCSLLTTLIHEIAYLNLAGMRFPVARDTLNHDNPLFQAVSAEEKRRWVEAKIINATTTCWLCKELNLLQTPLLGQERIKLLSKDQRAIVNEAKQQKMFEFHTDLETSVQAQCKWAFSHLALNDQAAVFKRIENYCKKWTSEVTP